MKISTEIASAAKIIGEEKTIEYVAKAGFDAWDFSMFSMCKYDWGTKTIHATDHPLSSDNYLSFARKLKQIGLDNGIHCNQSHAPFPVYCKEIRSYLKRAIECTAEAGGKICVIHPDNFMVACLDIGHAEMKGSDTTAVEMIEALGHRLAALHIHDNDKWHDSHQIPFSMDIDFAPIIKALKEIGYKGYFTLEADQYLRNYNAENIFDGIKNLAASAKKLVEIYSEI